MSASARDLVDSIQARLPREQWSCGAIVTACVSNQSGGFELARRVEEAEASAPLVPEG